MAYKQPAHEKASRGRDRGRGQPPRLGKTKNGNAMRFAQGVYPVGADDDTAIAFVDFIHDKANAILQVADMGPTSACFLDAVCTQPCGENWFHNGRFSPRQPSGNP